MHIPYLVSLLLFFVGSTSAMKMGDFGIFSACTTKNNSLRLNCSYAKCLKSPPFDCEFMTSSGSLLAKLSNEMCSLVLPDHRQRYHNVTTSYNCTLTRKDRREAKHITIDYSKTKGKDGIRSCPGTTGLVLHGAPTLLWPAVILSLCNVIITDRQTT